MTIDERLEFLTQSTESLHASCQELHAAIARQAEEMRDTDQRERRGRLAILAAITAYLTELNGDGEDDGEA